MPYAEIQPVIIALIGLFGVLATAYVGYRKVSVERHRVFQAEREIRFQRAALGFPEFVAEWGDIVEELTSLIDDTEIDRFMILRAWNGHLEPRWTTAVYQMRTADQAPVAYIHFELDRDYVDRVRRIVQTGPAYLVTDDLPDSEIRNVYLAEGIKASYWAYIDSIQTTDGNSKAVAYCSFATHKDGGIAPETMTRCKILVGRLKGLAHHFDRNTLL